MAKPTKSKTKSLDPISIAKKGSSKLGTVKSASYKNYVISSEFEGSQDPFREAVDRFWINESSNIIFDDSQIVNRITFDELKLGIKPLTTFDSGLRYDGTFQTLQVGEKNDILDAKISAKDIIGDKEKIATAVQSLEEIQFSPVLRTIELQNFACDKPIRYPSENTNSVKKGSPNASIEYVYNYELPNYENYISTITENQILNYYKDYGTIKSCFYSAKDLLPKSLRTIKIKKILKPKARDQIDKSLTEKTTDFLGTNSDIIVMESEMDRVEELNGPGLLDVPFYIKINIGKTSDPKENLSREIKETIYSNYSPAIVLPDPPSISVDPSKIKRPTIPAGSMGVPTTKGTGGAGGAGGAGGTGVSGIGGGGPTGIGVYNKGIYDRIANYCLQLTSPSANPELFTKRDFDYSYFSAEYKDQLQKDFKISKTIGSESLAMMDAIAMVDNLDEESVTLNSSARVPTLIGAEDLSTNKAKTAGLKKIFETLLDASRTPKLQKTYSDILDDGSEFYYTENIFYKISKFEENNLDTPIQNIFLPYKQKDVSYIDFQVKYGKRYIYKIYVYKFISGTNYTISVSNPVLEPVFSEMISQYEKQRDEIQSGEVTTSSSTTGGTTLTATESKDFDESIEVLMTFLNAVVDNPSKKWNMDTTVMVFAIQTFNEYKKIKILQNVREDIKSYLGNSLATIEEDRKNDLETALNLISELGKIVDNLIDDLPTTRFHTTLGKDKNERKKNAQNIVDELQDFLDTEEEIINLLTQTSTTTSGTGTGGLKPLTAVSSLEKEISALKNISYYGYPTINLAEIPYYENAGTILDNPPIFPDINFIPYKGNNRNISFFMNSGIGEVEQDPVIFSEEESAYFRLLRESRKYNEIQPITFNTDESKNMGASFEIYRMKSAPNNYYDFQNNLYQTISENFKGGTATLPSVSYLENIRPNQTYYYMFRVIDVRGNASNPSSVFSVMLVSENGLTFPVIEHYDFPKAGKIYSVPVKKLINVVPSINQIIPRAIKDSSFKSYESYSSKGDVDGIMGVEEVGIFGKIFKLRFTSKKTGKQLDLNIRFKTELT